MTKIVMQLDWYQQLGEVFHSNDMDKISKGIDFAIEKHGDKSVYPKKELIFKAFELTPLSEVKVVMIGLEPNAETASGLLLESTHAPIDKMNEQLIKVFSIYCKDYPNNFNTSLMSGSTTMWAEQGVLMLNMSLSARAGQSKKHLQHWSFLTNKVLEVLKMRDRAIAFIPLGITPTEVVKQLSLPKRHRDFQFKEGVFLEVNKFLKDNDHSEIDW